MPFFAPIPDHELTIEFTPLLSNVNDAYADRLALEGLSLIHISEPTRPY